MKALQRNEKILIALVLLSGCALLEHSFLGAKAQDYAAQTAQLNLINQDIVTAKAELEKYSGRGLASAPSFPPREDLERFEATSRKLSSFLKEITSQEDDDRFSLNRISTEAGSESGAFLKTPVVVEVEATFPAVGRFLERLEDAPLLAEIDSVELYRVPDDLRMVTAKIRLLTYSGGK